MANIFDVRQPATLGQLTQLYMGNPNLTPTQVGNSLSMQPAGYIDKQGEALGLGNPTQYFQKQYDARKSAMQAGEAQAYAAQSGQAPARQAAPAPVASLQPRYSAASAMGDLAKAEARAQGLTDDQYNAMHGGLPGYGAYDQQRNRDNPQIERARLAEMIKASDAGLPMPARTYNYADPSNPEAAPKAFSPFVRGAGFQDFSVIGQNDLDIYRSGDFDADLDADEIDKINKQIASSQSPAKPIHIVDYTTHQQFMDDAVFVRLMQENPEAAGKIYSHILKRDINEVIKERREMGARQALTAESRNYEAAQAKQERIRAADLKIAADQLARHNQLRDRMEKGDYAQNKDTGKWQKKKLVPNKKAQEEEDVLGTGSKSLPTMIWSGEMEDLGTNDPTSEELTNAASPEHQKEILAIIALANDPKKQADIAARKLRMEEGLPDSTFNDMGGITAMPSRHQIEQTQLANIPGANGLRRLFSGPNDVDLVDGKLIFGGRDSMLARGPGEGNYYTNGIKGAGLQFLDTFVGENNAPHLQNFGKGFANFLGGRWAKSPVDYSNSWANKVRAGLPANMGVRHVSQKLRENPAMQRLLITDRPRALAIIAALQTQSPEQMSPETLKWNDLIKD